MLLLFKDQLFEIGSFFKEHLILSHGTIVCHDTVFEHWFKVTLLNGATQCLRLTRRPPMLLNASGIKQQLQNYRVWHQQQAPFISSVVFIQHRRGCISFVTALHVQTSLPEGTHT